MIDKNIPFTPRGRGRRDTYPWARMNVGDSFLYLGGTLHGAWNTIAYAQKKYVGKVFKPKNENNNGIRIWRVS